MSSIFDGIQQQLGGVATQQISQRLGLDPNMTQIAINAAIPAILGGMAAHASKQQGADQIHSEADNHPASTTAASPIGSVSPDGGLLGRMLGHRTQAVQDGVAQASGIDSGNAGKLIGMLAPVVMSAIAQQKQGGGLNSSNIGSVLAGAKSQAHATATKQSPGLGGLLGSVLSQIQAS